MFVIIVIGYFLIFNFSTNDKLIFERAMKTNNSDSNQVTKVCKLCKKQFIPHPKVKDRQKVCSRYDCQQLRQKLNRLDWVERNPVDYPEWYQRYGKAWQQSHPTYQREYRKHRAEHLEHTKPKAITNQNLKSLLWLYQHEKREELTSVKTKSQQKKLHDKKEELSSYLYLVKARELEFLPLNIEKREELSYGIHSY